MIADSLAHNQNANANATLDSQPPAYDMLTDGSFFHSRSIIANQLILLTLVCMVYSTECLELPKGCQAPSASVAAAATPGNCHARYPWHTPY